MVAGHGLRVDSELGRWDDGVTRDAAELKSL